MKAKELRSFGPEDLVAKEKSLKRELSELKYQRKIGRVEKPSRFKLVKRDIARILTVLQEKRSHSLQKQNKG